MRRQLKTPEPKNDSPDNQFKELIQLLAVRELHAISSSSRSFFLPAPSHSRLQALYAPIPSS
jgi:hypothetical protein